MSNRNSEKNWNLTNKCRLLRPVRLVPGGRSILVVASCDVVASCGVVAPWGRVAPCDMVVSLCPGLLVRPFFCGALMWTLDMVPWCGGAL